MGMKFSNIDVCRFKIIVTYIIQFILIIRQDTGVV